MMEQIMMVGAGAVGGFFGAHLAKKHENVSFLLRPRTLEAVKSRGLIIQSSSGALTVHPCIAADPRDLPPPDLIILGVKVYDLDEVMRQIAPVVGNETVILSLQNGVTIEDRLMDRFGRERIVGGVAFIYAKILEPGMIAHYKRGAVTIGEIMGQETPRVSCIAALFQDAGISCRISRDIRRAKWEKMCWNCVFNPLTVVVNDRIAKALDHPDMSRVITSIVEEVCAVATGQHVPLEGNMAEKVVQWSQEIRDIHTSMYDDWKAGRTTEIDDLNGYIVRMGKELGIPTPVNEALTAIVKVITEQPHPHAVLQIDGEVVQPLSFDEASLAKIGSDYQVPDVSTIASGLRGRGVRMEGLLDVATLRPGADHVTFHAQDGHFAASLTLEQTREYGIVIYELEGGPLSQSEGGPFRLVTPGLGDLCANVKHVARIELSKGLGRDTRPSLKCSP